jgi:hypothetical protein
MSAVTSPVSINTPTQTPRLLLPIFVGGAIAGTLDLIAAFHAFGWRVPKGIAMGLLGSRAIQGGAGMWILGVVLHFTIAFGAAAIYCLAARRLTYLRESFIVCGLFYGIAVWLVMNLVVLPLSAFPVKTNTFTRSGLTQGILTHMLIIGLPIAISARLFSRRAA